MWEPEIGPRIAWKPELDDSDAGAGGTLQKYFGGALAEACTQYMAPENEGASGTVKAWASTSYTPTICQDPSLSSRRSLLRTRGPGKTD
jgi:hypothetical protein